MGDSPAGRSSEALLEGWSSETLSAGLSEGRAGASSRSAPKSSTGLVTSAGDDGSALTAAGAAFLVRRVRLGLGLAAGRSWEPSSSRPAPKSSSPDDSDFVTVSTPSSATTAFLREVRRGVDFESDLVLDEEVLLVAMGKNSRQSHEAL